MNRTAKLSSKTEQELSKMISERQEQLINLRFSCDLRRRAELEKNLTKNLEQLRYELRTRETNRD